MSVNLRLLKKVMWSSSIGQTVDSNRPTVGSKANCAALMFSEDTFVDFFVRGCKADSAQSERRGDSRAWVVIPKPSV